MRLIPEFAPPLVNAPEHELRLGVHVARSAATKNYAAAAPAGCARLESSPAIRQCARCPARARGRSPVRQAREPSACSCPASAQESYARDGRRDARLDVLRAADVAKARSIGDELCNRFAAWLLGHSRRSHGAHWRRWAGVGCGSSSVSSVTSPSVVPRCQTTVSAPTAAFGPNGGTGTATVGAPRECLWTASTQAAWITIMPPASGQGDGNVSFRVGENPDPAPRQGAMVVSDGSVELSQAAAPCAFTVGSNTDVVGAEGGTLAIDVRTNAACSWTASTDAPWATPSPASGKGTQTVRVAVAPNSGPERSARATIANQQLTFSQRGPALCRLPPHQHLLQLQRQRLQLQHRRLQRRPTPAPPTPAPPTPAPPHRHRHRTPAPTPPPPPPPAPKTVTLSGKIKSSSGVCPNVTYVLKEGTVVTTPATDFQKRSCDSIKPGDDIKVEGIELEGGVIRATVVTKK